MTTATQYRKIKNDPERYIKEKERINNIVSNRYKTDEEYRLRCLEYQRKRRQLLSNQKIEV
jgi:hypothetical protein